MSKNQRNLVKKVQQNGNGYNNGNGNGKHEKNNQNNGNGNTIILPANGQKSMPEPVLKNRLKSRTPNQREYIKTIQSNDIVISFGPPGVGKTRLAVGAAATYLSKGYVDRIVLVRPTVSCDEELGFLPGALCDKLSPYLRPAFDELYDFFTIEQINAYTSGNYPLIEGVPLGMIKGRTFKNSFIILDEAQDATYKQLKSFLTRIGEGSKMVITGDVTQSDLCPSGAKTPLEEIMDKLRDIDKIGFAKLTEEDIQRHTLISTISRRI
jgi:phosphate starvation-inducible PhoH-like protein